MKKNKFLNAPPYAVESSLKELGANLRTARLRRELTLQEVADKTGIGVRAIRDAEYGKVTTGIGVYTALLWVYGLIDQLYQVADPRHDAEGLALARRHEGVRVRHRHGDLDNDF